MEADAPESKIKADNKKVGESAVLANRDSQVVTDSGDLNFFGQTWDTPDPKVPVSRHAGDQAVPLVKDNSVTPSPSSSLGNPEGRITSASPAVRAVPPGVELEQQRRSLSESQVPKPVVSEPNIKSTAIVSSADAPSKVATNVPVSAETAKLNLFPSPTAFDTSKANIGNAKADGSVQATQARDVATSLVKPSESVPVERSSTAPIAEQMAPAKTPLKVDVQVTSAPVSLMPQSSREFVATEMHAKPDVGQVSISSRNGLPDQGPGKIVAVPQDLAQPKTVTLHPIESRTDLKASEVKFGVSPMSEIAAPRDTKSAGLANEVLGAKPVDRSEPSGAKSDFVNAINNKVDQAVAGKLPQGETHSDGGAVGGKQPTTNDASTSTNPTGKQTATEAGGAAGKQPTAADVANTGSRQPATEVGGRAPGSGGGGGAGVPDAATSTHKNESINNPGSKGDNSAGTGSAGSSAPTDRAPHKPFGVEDSQGTKSISTDGKPPDGSGMKTADAAGGKVAEGVGGKVADGVGSGKTPAGASATGPRFDVGETKVSTPGSPGSPGSGSAGGATAAGAGSGRFDVPDLKVGSGTGSGGGGSQIESAQIPGQKGFDVTGGKSMPEGIMNQGTKSPIGRVGEGIKVGDDNPVVLPGMIAGREGGRRPNEQVIGEKPNQPVLGGKPSSDDTVIKGPKDNTGKLSEVGGVPVISGPADMGGALRNFAQSVLSTDKGDQTAGKGPSAGKDPVKSQPVEEGPKTFAGPGQKTTVLGADSNEPGRRIQGAGAVAGEIGKGSSASGIPGGKKDELGIGEVSSEGDSSESAADLVPLEEFALPAVDLLAESDRSAEVDESVDEAGDAEEFDERTYELALGLQLYNAVAEAQYGAYHYFTREGDTVELVSRDVVGEPRTAPLVFSLNKEHILASTEYGVHPFKVGVMIQLPTPREIKMYFGSQTK